MPSRPPPPTPPPAEAAQPDYDAPQADQEADDGGELRAAIDKYTDISERQLKPWLDAACEQRDALFNGLAKIDVQRHALEALRAGCGAGDAVVRTRANIGEELYMAAEVDSSADVVLELCDGVLVEVSAVEALRLVGERQALLEKLAARATDRIVQAQANLKGMTESIAALRVADN